VNVLAGFGITPSAFATAPLATKSKTPMVVMAAATSSITQASPYVVRTSFTLPQAAELQLPVNVHFHEKGSAVLATKVAAEIERRLPKK
jgi:hypothetical protein